MKPGSPLHLWLPLFELLKSVQECLGIVPIQREFYDCPRRTQAHCRVLHRAEQVVQRVYSASGHCLYAIDCSFERGSAGRCKFRFERRIIRHPTAKRSLAHSRTLRGARDTWSQQQRDDGSLARGNCLRAVTLPR
jgi:hypothetical protein